MVCGGRGVLGVGLRRGYGGERDVRLFCVRQVARRRRRRRRRLSSTIVSALCCLREVLTLRS